MTPTSSKTLSTTLNNLTARPPRARASRTATVALVTVAVVALAVGSVVAGAAVAVLVRQQRSYAALAARAAAQRSTGDALALLPADLRSAELTARWEQQLQNIGKGKADMKKFIGDMKKFASALVSEVIASDAQYKYDNMTREKCPQCGKYLLEVNGKRGKSLVCPDRECGYRKGVSQISNARCPDCFKKMELRGEGDKKVFVCTNCGHRERLSDFQKRHEDNSRGAGRGDVEAYRCRQKEEEKKAAASASPFADLMKMFEK